MRPGVRSREVSPAVAAFVKHLTILPINKLSKFRTALHLQGPKPYGFLHPRNLIFRVLPGGVRESW
jgi:hypothetical protein